MGSRARKPAPVAALPVVTPEAPLVDHLRGQIDIWPIMAAEEADLIAEIERGDHDGYLADIQHADRSQYAGRPSVQSAIRNRRGE